jgi:adenine-specific DNA methylase
LTPPRLLIEEWLPAAAIGVECIRERSTGQQPPDKRLHVWWARRPLVVSRAAVLASLLPADFPREVFERLLGFWGSSRDLLAAQMIIDGARVSGGRVQNPHGERAFAHAVLEDDLARAHAAASGLWGDSIAVIDPMAGGGSIPLESARLGFTTLANEYNPVACSVLEATVDYPFRFGQGLADRSRKWGAALRNRFNARMQQFYPSTGVIPPHTYIFARTVPCPDTGFATPLVPDWHLLKPKSGLRLAAVPIVDKGKGSWTVRFREVGKAAGQMREAPPPTYGGGKGISLFSGRAIPAEYIWAKAQASEMGSALYAVALKTPKGLKFQPPEAKDLAALQAAEAELARLRPGWEAANIIPTERIPLGDKTGEPLNRGMDAWDKLFSSRQLLLMGVLVEELRRLRPDILAAEGEAVGEAVVHLLALVVDKFVNYNAYLASWHAPRQVMRSVFDRHDYAFKATYAEMAPCGAGAGLAWAIDNVLEAYEEIARLPRHPKSSPVEISLGSATNLSQILDGSITAVVVDPPYDDNVQYSELADFFYVWLKRTLGHRRPEWFSTYLCEHDQEAVVNVSRHRDATAVKTGGKRDGSAASAKEKAREFYRRLMHETFLECKRILRDDGVLTVMFTHKKQEAWEALFSSLIGAGFAITATWPVKTESEHSLHQAQKNAAQSTVLLVARERQPGAGVGFFDSALQAEIQQAARAAAERLEAEGLNPVDQLVGSFGPAMAVYSRFDEVRTDTGEVVGVDRAIELASDAVSAWRVERLAKRGLEGVEPEGRFVLLCWDVLRAAEFRFNEAKLLGHAVGMDVDSLVAAGLVSKSGDKIQMLSAKDRRRDRALEGNEIVETLFGPAPGGKKRRRKKDTLKVHPNDPSFRTALDGCHALALRYLETGGGSAGTGNARALLRQQNWGKDSVVARLMEALVHAAPEAVRFERGKTSAGVKFPEFRAWQALLKPLFDITPPEWTEAPIAQPRLMKDEAEDQEDSEEGEE